MSRTRIVITGMGWITPLGHDLESAWGRLIRGESGISPIDRFDASTFPTTFAGQIRDLNLADAVEDIAAHEGAGLHSRFALGAARQAWTQAGLDDFPGLNRDRTGLYLGGGESLEDFSGTARSHLAGWDADTESIDAVRWAAAAQRHLEPRQALEQDPNMAMWHLAREYGLRGPAYNCLTACAASTQAIGEAASLMRRGDADVMVTGGTHTMLHVLGVTGFNRLTALSTFDGDPAKAARPYCRSRDGFVMGEGSGILLLETLPHALNRGASPLAEIAGFGSSADAYRITDIHPDGRGPADAMRQGLAEAGIDPLRANGDRPPVDYLSAHGTGTKENDSIETRAVKAVFGEQAPRLAISSIKSMMGHLIAAAGAVELIACVLAIRDGVIPPTINLHDPDPELDLDFVPNEARHSPVDVCLSNSFGFGGQNNTLVVRRFEKGSCPLYARTASTPAAGS